MASGGIVSIELVVGAATFVLGTRLISLIQATRSIPGAHAQVLEGVSGGDLQRLQSKARGLGYQNPYGDLASDVIRAGQSDARDADERRALISQADQKAQKSLARRTQQGQTMDLVALGVACGIVTFARDALPTGRLFWSLAGAIMILLLSTVAARGQLKASVAGALDSLRETLVSRPQLPSISDGPIDCFWCGARTEIGTYEIRAQDSDDVSEVEAALCPDCGKLVTTLTVEDSVDSDEPENSENAYPSAPNSNP